MKTLTSFLNNAFKVEITDDETEVTQTHEFQDETAVNLFVEGLRVNNATIDIYHNGKLVRSFGTIGAFWQ